MYSVPHNTTYTANYCILFSVLQTIQLITVTCSPYYNLYSSLLYPVLRITNYTDHYCNLFSILQQIQLIIVSCSSYYHQYR